MADALEVLVLCGSPRELSYTRGLARTSLRELSARGAKVHLFDLRHSVLPPMEPALRRQRERHPDPSVGAFIRKAETTDAYVLASPVYHNSFSGVLKNAIDYLTIADFRYRPVGLISHGGRSTQAVDQLRQVVRGLHGVPIPTQVCTGEADFGAECDDGGAYELVDPDILARIDRFADELLLFARSLKKMRAAEAAEEGAEG